MAASAPLARKRGRSTCRTSPWAREPDEDGVLQVEAGSFDASLGRQFAATALDLLALLINERSGRFTSPAPETAAATLVRVQDHIRRNLSDPGLSPTGIARPLHVGPLPAQALRAGVRGTGSRPSPAAGGS
ncbi:hypothetical protein LZ269_12140 [Streptomyces lomondensis]|uniref:Uncharacterized protein n=1 Tax=Streptomyces lomondensis TaxID=68229 RepID=A0ABQ2X5R4_9ACTN|nr:hypothetical protein [Streptomyces lomondensis]MCF0078161.1 hypothetical protein [Streptomyces lomondensis]GGX00843.1 hypothetical protein GCM10010383_33600 [Streptomyces lomondensis]